MTSLVLLIAAFVLFLMAAVGVPSLGRINFTNAGLACWVLALLLEGNAP